MECRVPKAFSQPTYQLHRGSGQAGTIVEKKTIYLGAYNSPKSQEKFNDLLAE